MRESFVNDWYFIYRKYDDITIVHNLPTFIAQSTAITDIKKRVKIDDVPLPVVHGNEIVIPKWVGTPQAWVEFFGHTVSLPIVLGCANGMLLDAVQKTNKDLLGLSKEKLNVNNKEKLLSLDDEMYRAILKIFVDLLGINFNSKSKYAEFLWFYYEILYGQINVMEIDTLSDYLLALNMYYLPENHPQVEYLLPDEVNVLKTQKTKKGLEALFDLLLERFDFDEQDNSQQQEQNSEEQDNSEQDSENNNESEEQEQNNEESNSENNGEAEQQKESESSEFTIESKDETLKNINADRTEMLVGLNSEAGEELESIVEKIFYEFEERGDMKLPKIYVRKPDSSRQDINEINVPTDFGFLKDLLRARTKNRTYGVPRNKGRKIVPVRITRAATDGKIFSYDQDIEVWKPPEIILLVDGSGSMRVHLTSGVRFYDYVLAVAYKIFNEVKNITKTSVYVHTSINARSEGMYDTDLEEFPVLYDLNNGSYHNSFSNALNINNRVNYDGIAIDEVVKRHSKDIDRKKLLIILSDGMPAGTNADDYSGKSAVEHMREVMARAKKLNFEIIGVSLLPDTDRTIRYIYGNNFVSCGDLQKNLTNVIVKALG